ncbi:serine/threonine-protein kinase [Nocardioides sp. WS12]|uniref:serine/threonine-protein kinase n=1 Tax=Nocardioides sp. WS12 TaxID=2486272 RepID=UPI0015F82F45|nr:serine/threonine-protein kinase [Nocardioides sp. WS12]
MSLPPHPAALPPGELLGPYRIVRELGAGGMGTVYEAVDTTLHRNVALKVITSALAGDPGFRARFVREAQAQASLDSPHVVQVFAHGQVGGQLYIASQLIPDGDLGATLRRHGPPPPAVAVDLIAQVADGLAEAHRVGLVHRDIKPANVLLRNRGTDTFAYLGDFGIARQIGADQSATGGVVAGTPSYMAPELHQGRPAGPVSDVYSLGCLLWATLTGRAPYVGTTDYQVVEAHIGAPIPQSTGRTAFDRELNRVLRTALAKNPHERYPSAAAFRDDLRSLPGTTSVRPRRSAAVIAATVGGIAALVVLIALAAVLIGRGDDGDRSAGTDTSTDPTTPQGLLASREETTIANIAQTLAEEADLDADDADCTARELVKKHGVDGLQEQGLIDDDLMLVEDGNGKVKPGILADIFTSTFSCLWE